MSPFWARVKRESGRTKNMAYWLKIIFASSNFFCTPQTHIQKNSYCPLIGVEDDQNPSPTKWLSFTWYQTRLLNHTTHVFFSNYGSSPSLREAATRNLLGVYSRSHPPPGLETIKEFSLDLGQTFTANANISCIAQIQYNKNRMQPQNWGINKSGCRYCLGENTYRKK